MAKLKMKPGEISNALMQISEAMKREEKYCEANAKPKYSCRVAVALAHNKRTLEEELRTIIEVEEKNKKLAKNRGIPIESLEEQKEFMSTDIDINLRFVTKDDVEKCTDLTASDFYALLIMTEQDEKEGE